jgi:hypothetical protein
MTTYASFTAIGLLAGIIATVGGCSSDDTSATLDGGPTTEGEASGDAGTPGETDASTVVDTGAEAAASCGAFTTGAPACDTCVQANCCTAAATCDVPDDAGLSDAGLTSCEQLVSCVSDFCADGGSLSDCEGTCNPTYAQSVQTSANDLLTCTSTNCQAQCQ